MQNKKQSGNIVDLQAAQAATNSNLQKLEVTVATAFKYMDAGSFEALEQRLAETQLLVQRRSW